MNLHASSVTTTPSPTTSSTSTSASALVYKNTFKSKNRTIKDKPQILKHIGLKTIKTPKTQHIWKTLYANKQKTKNTKNKFDNSGVVNFWGLGLYQP